MAKVVEVKTIMGRKVFQYQRIIYVPVDESLVTAGEVGTIVGFKTNYRLSVEFSSGIVQFRPIMGEE